MPGQYERNAARAVSSKRPKLRTLFLKEKVEWKMNDLPHSLYCIDKREWYKMVNLWQLEISAYVIHTSFPGVSVSLSLSCRWLGQSIVQSLYWQKKLCDMCTPEFFCVHKSKKN